jgi:hypothetical protein
LAFVPGRTFNEFQHSSKPSTLPAINHKRNSEMKRTLLFFLLFFSTYLYGQEENTDSTCYVIQFISKRVQETNPNITPEYQPKGFYLLKNGVYDFIIDGKKYFQSILLRIDKDGFQISRNWESTSSGEKILDSTKFSINQNIQIRLVSINNGVGGLPFKTKTSDYHISIIPTEKYCMLKDVKITSKDQTYIGHFYFTAYGLKEIKMVKGKPYLIEPKGEYIMRRN